MRTNNILITGGSRGIGAEIAKLSTQAGYEPIITFANNSVAADDVVLSIENAGGKCHALQADFENPSDISKIFDYIKNTFGYLDCLVNNAGIIVKQCSILDMTPERLQKNFSVNLIAPILCAKEAIPLMSERGGAIVNVSSAASRYGSPHEYVDYAAAKGGLDTFTLGLAKEVAERNIRVNAVRPGLIYTDIHASAGEPGRVDRLKNLVPLQRGGTPSEVAKAVMWLCSEEASYVTGALLDVAGGR